MYIVCLIVLTFFAVIGLATFISAIRSSALACDGEMLLILPDIDKSCAEARVRRAASVAESVRGCRIIAVCTDEASKEICERLKIQFDNLETVDRDAVHTIL
jgi:hypothetical protein